MALRPPEIPGQHRAPTVILYINVWYILEIDIPDNAAVVLPAFRRTEGEPHIPQGDRQGIAGLGQKPCNIEIVGAIGAHFPEKTAVEFNLSRICNPLQTEQNPPRRPIRSRKVQPALRLPHAKGRKRHFFLLRRTAVDTVLPPGRQRSPDTAVFQGAVFLFQLHPPAPFRLFAPFFCRQLYHPFTYYYKLP